MVKLFNEQVQVLTKNLSSLNTIYEPELQESNHLKSLNQFYGKFADASKAMTNTADDANKEKDQIALLATNLNKLNQIYGNMISAMSGSKNKSSQKELLKTLNPGNNGTT